jgi:acid phosphatase class B
VIFGIDFDNTFSADPVLFHSFLDLLTARGHSAVIITGRTKPTGSHGLDEFAVEVTTKCRIPIIYAGMKLKRLAAQEAGYNIDIWIDDNPVFIDGVGKNG